MKRKNFANVILMIFMALSLLSIGAKYAQASEEDAVTLDLDTAIYTSKSVVESGGTGVVGNYALGTYDILTFENVDMSIKEISLAGSYSKSFDWNAVSVRIVFDDNSEYITSVTRSDWIPITTGEGKLVKSIRISHGISGVTYTAESFQVKLWDAPVYTLTDSAQPVNPVFYEGANISGDLLFIANNGYSAAEIEVNSIVDNVTVVGNLLVGENDNSPNSWVGYLTVYFYIADGTRESTVLPVDKLTVTQIFTVPNSMKGKVITKIRVGYSAYTSVIRKIDIATTENIIQSIKVTPNPLTFATAGTKQLKVIATMADGTTKDITSDSDTEYDVDDTDVVTVSSKGLVKTASGIQNGDKAVITIQSGEAEATCKVTISIPNVKSIKSSTSSVILSSVAGKNTKQLKISAVMKSGKNETITKLATYTSSNTKYFTVSSSGVLTVKTGTPKGKTGVITVSYGDKTCKISIKVK